MSHSGRDSECSLPLGIRQLFNYEHLIAPAQCQARPSSETIQRPHLREMGTMSDAHAVGSRVNLLIETLSDFARQHDAASLFRVLAERVKQLIDCERFTVVF